MFLSFLPSAGWLGGKFAGEFFLFLAYVFVSYQSTLLLLPPLDLVLSSSPSSSSLPSSSLPLNTVDKGSLTKVTARRSVKLCPICPIELAHRFWCGAIPEVYSEEQEGDSGDSRHCVRSCRRSVDDNCRCTVDPVANKWESKFATLSRFFDFCRGCVTRMAAPSPNLLAKGLPILTPTALNPHAPVGKWILGTSSLVCAMVHIGG